jgi:molybdenum cofactor cytidylyltransferase
MHGSTAAVVPAAGRSERFGGMKLLADVHGEPLLDHTLRCLIAAGIEPIVVVQAPNASLDPVALLRHPRVRAVVNADPSRGMFSSIQAGLAASPAARVLVLPADMPFVQPATVARVAAECARTDQVVVPAHAGRRGHPVGLPARIRDGLLMMPPTRSLKDALAALGEDPYVVDVGDEGVVRDVDRREDLR